MDKKPSKHFDRISKQLETVIADNNIYATTLVDLLNSKGQVWLETLKLSLNKPVDQEVVISLFIAINQYFNLPLNTLVKDVRGTRSIEVALQHSDEICENPIDTDLKAIINALDNEYLPLIEAMLVLAQMGEHTLIPIFSGNDSVGTVMRKRLLPLTTPLLEKVDILM